MRHPGTTDARRGPQQTRPETARKPIFKPTREPVFKPVREPVFKPVREPARKPGSFRRRRSDHASAARRTRLGGRPTRENRRSAPDGPPDKNPSRTSSGRRTFNINTKD